ncbi:hypothetical protein PBI_ANDREW_26 [Arthrobacter phage Andrew]|uniref:Uncharacterized protein n=1 Tax=Arthrobacter phage Andrew TaxID=2419946 RepID=A0A3G2KCV3_9CAUD|nr:hypothetical protein HOU53_gp26 [Arthrobacter phage Andrew]AYN56842.1 hypothetical protein PBI_ANDREW_26 [Arthrobacter phage Andrew]
MTAELPTREALQELRRDGWTLEQLAERYAATEKEVWSALHPVE